MHSVKPNHRRSSKSELWALAGNEINFELVLATVTGIGMKLLLAININNVSKFAKSQQIEF